MTKTTETFCFRPSSRMTGVSAYAPGERPAWVDLFLDANEGEPIDGGLVAEAVGLEGESLRRYPFSASLEGTIAAGMGVDASRVVVTSGGDDAIDRVCRIALEPGRELLVHSPTFEMIARSARLAGAGVSEIEWLGGAFPVDDFIEGISDRTGLVAIVSPNNPTGGVLGLEEMRSVVEVAGRVGALVLVDLAYIEYADEDPTASLLEYENVVVVRTFSKAYGLAGLRVGYAVGAERVVRLLRAVGGPYPVSSVSLAIAQQALKASDRIADVAADVRQRRETITSRLTVFGCEVCQSQANFVLVRTPRARWLWSSLVALGIATRRFGGKPGLENAVRITVPVDKSGCDRLLDAIETIMEPEALLFDLDGVLADVSGSYRRAIIGTAQSFGVNLSPMDIQRAKDAGDANNDWVVTHRLLAARGVDVEFDEVKARFQELYLGDQSSPGLRECETLIGSVAYLKQLGERWRLAVVTGRPRAEADWFLERFGIAAFFDAVICMEDAAAKPSAEPVLRALDQLGVRSAWMIGDTPDDIVAARGARVLPIGVVAPGQETASASLALGTSGAAAVLSNIECLTEYLP